jgi:LysM repeat protein
MVDAARGTGPLSNTAAQERQRLLAEQAKQRQQLQQTAHHLPAEDRAALDKELKADPNVVSKDSFVRDAQVGDTSSEERQALYDKFNTDGQDGLSQSEFDAAFASYELEAAKTHTVQSGDSLSKIAAQYGHSWQELYQHGNNAKAIGNNPNMIQPGQQLEIPEEWLKPQQEALAAAQAKTAIDTAQVSPDRAGGASPDRMDEQQQSDNDKVAAAQQALDQIPADDPQRADYEKKVADLKQTVDHKWMQDEAGQQAIAGEQLINQVTSEKPDPATNSVNGQCLADPKAFRDAVDGNVQQLEDALAKIPQDDPAYKTFEAQVNGYKQDAEMAKMQSQLNEKAGHPVAIKFGDHFGDADKAREYDTLKKALNDPSFDAMWSHYDTIEFNTYTQYQDGAKDNLNKYTEVDGKTLKINNPAKDGVTDAELDKQWRALEYTRDHNKGS